MSNYLLIPQNSENDKHLTGFYTTKNSGVLHLRVQESLHPVEGIIRLNKSNPSEYLFEGYDGKKWVQFNAKQGIKGDKGDDFINHFNFKNVSSNDSNDLNNQGLIFKTTNLEINQKNQESSNIEIRSLSSGHFTINNTELESMKIDTRDNEIILNPIPQPYIWDMSNLSIPDMKSNNSNQRFKAYGKTSFWSVNSNYPIIKGQCVCIDSINNKIIIRPINYNSSELLNLFNNPIQFLGIALEDSIDKTKIEVCTEGITTVKCNLDNQGITSDCMNNLHLSKVGLIGMVSGGGYVFNSSIKPFNDYIKAGYFLEDGIINQQNNYLLFKIEK